MSLTLLKQKLLNVSGQIVTVRGFKKNPFYPLLPALKGHFQAVINVLSKDNTLADAHTSAASSRLK